MKNVIRKIQPKQIKIPGHAALMEEIYKCNFSGNMRRINLIDVRIYVWLVREKDQQDANFSSLIYSN